MLTDMGDLKLDAKEVAAVDSFLRKVRGDECVEIVLQLEIVTVKNGKPAAGYTFDNEGQLKCGSDLLTQLEGKLYAFPLIAVPESHGGWVLYLVRLEETPAGG